MTRLALPLLLGALWANSATAAQETDSYTYATYFYCDVTQQDRADEIVEKLDKPFYDAAVADGSITAWGWMEHIVGGEYRRLSTMTAADVNSLMAARASIVAAMRDDPLAATLDDICGSHADYVWEIKFEKP